MGEASMRKWLRRALMSRPGVTADDIPGWRRWILRVWRSPRLRAAMRGAGLPLYHTALHLRLRERRRREFWRRAATAPGGIVKIRDWEDFRRNGPAGAALDGLRAMAHG